MIKMKKFYSWLAIAIIYVLLIGLVLPWLVSAKSSIAFIIAVLVGIVFFILIPVHYVVRKIKEGN